MLIKGSIPTTEPLVSIGLILPIDKQKYVKITSGNNLNYEIKALENQLSKATRNELVLPKSEDEIAEWTKKYPDVAYGKKKVYDSGSDFGAPTFKYFVSPSL